MKAVPTISDFHLLLSTGLVVIVGAISALLRLGLFKSLLWGTARTFLQLLVAIVLVMCLMAGRASLGRLKQVPGRPFGLAVLSLGASTFLVGTIVCAVIIGGEKWFAARLVIPIAGMILGNSLNGISLSLDRLYGEIRARSREVEARLCLGYTVWQAIRPHLRIALRAGMMPIINSLMVVGVVSLPGMMTGQILAGADPLTAVRYQIVVMLMIAAAVAVGSLIMVGLSYKRCFTDDDALKPELRASPTE
jgi:putative ABC transport system permease protein